MHAYPARVMSLSVVVVMVCLWLSAGEVLARKYELTRNNIQNPADIDGTQVSLYGVKLGDSEVDAIEKLINQRIPGVRAEQEGVFIMLWDQSNPTGSMAGVELRDGKVTLIYINNRFAYKTRGIFRRVLTAQSAEEIRELLGPEDWGDVNVMGAMLHYERQGFTVNYLGRDINVVFELP
ncbi:MAG: hypothetical protein D6704_07675 [Nitrospirae bacterium]|nr:MAG: hypothetical protein D6704_07675 [Nitrospirota bacterium]